MAHSLSAACRDLLTRQDGVIARHQVRESGPDLAVIDARLRSGRWQSTYRGVYASFTGPLPRSAVLWAAVLRGGEGAVLSHHTAAELDRLADDPGPMIHLSTGDERRIHIGREGGASLPRVLVHRSARLDVARHPARLPPRTRIEETTLDLAQCAASLEDAWGWLSRSCARRLTTPQLLAGAMSSRARMKWRPELTQALSVIGDGAHSVLEVRYVNHVERPHGLPAARRQVLSKVNGRTRYLDNLYEEFGVAVELDGQLAHPIEARWADIHRDNSSALAGLITLRYSWADLATRRCQSAAEIGGVLRTRGWPGHLRPCGNACTVLLP